VNTNTGCLSRAPMNLSSMMIFSLLSMPFFSQILMVSRRTGLIPLNIGGVNKFTSLKLNNCLTGTFPSSLGSLAGLFSLYLSTSLVGPLSSTTEVLRSLCISADIVSLSIVMCLACPDEEGLDNGSQYGSPLPLSSSRSFVDCHFQQSFQTCSIIMFSRPADIAIVKYPAGLMVINHTIPPLEILSEIHNLNRYISDPVQALSQLGSLLSTPRDSGAVLDEIEMNRQVIDPHCRDVTLESWDLKNQVTFTVSQPYDKYAVVYSLIPLLPLYT
jgi:hypothetical protein